MPTSQDIQNRKHRKVEIIECNEPWTTVKLADGTTIRIKIIVTGAHIVLEDDGKTPVKGDDGAPLYAYNHQMIGVVEHFEEVPKGTKVS